jgi:sugar-specific transcriptional regulator TrmB
LDDIGKEQQLLEEMGISPLEAEIYLELLTGGSRGAAAIADASGRPRSSIYAALRALADEGLVEGGAGYGSRYRAVPPAQALKALVTRERQRLTRREELIEEITPRLEQMATEEEALEEQVIEILRNRQLISDRFERLQLEAEREIDVFVKDPPMATRPGNPAELRALKRGVRDRGLYEESVLDLPDVGSWMAHWAAAGEEIRIYPGPLPIKMAMADRRNVLLPLPTATGVTAVLIRHPDLGEALHMLFEQLWEQSEPYSTDEPALAGSGKRGRNQ